MPVRSCRVTITDLQSRAHTVDVCAATLFEAVALALKAAHCVGGALGLHQATARPVGYRCAATEVPDALERLLGRYLAEREGGENLRRFFARHNDTQLREFLAGEMVPAVARDLPQNLPQSTGGIGD